MQIDYSAHHYRQFQAGPPRCRRHVDEPEPVHQAGACVYSACSGVLMLAEMGLLNGCDVTSHWGYQDLFRRQYPQVRFRPEPNLCFADAAGRIVTAGGTTSWHDLALHIISRHVSPGEAMRIREGLPAEVARRRAAAIRAARAPATAH